MLSLILGLVRFFASFAFGWLRCPWCGTWFPKVGAIRPNECRHCGRVV